MTDELREPTVYSLEIDGEPPFIHPTLREESRSEKLISALLYFAVAVICAAASIAEGGLLAGVGLAVVALGLVILGVKEAFRWRNFESIYGRPS